VAAAEGDREEAALFGRRLRRLRAAAGFTQDQLAERAGVGVRTVRQLELGAVRRPQAASLRRLAVALGVEVEQLTGPAPQASEHPDLLRIGVLGPVEVRRGETAVPVASPMIRTLLGVLGLQPGRAVGIDELVDALWEEDPPRTCRDLVHTYVSQARRLLGIGREGPLRRDPLGYRLLLGPDASDAAAFQDLLRRARQAVGDGVPASAWQFYTEALACWRGPFPAESAHGRQPAAVALERERLAAVVAWADLGLASARYDKVLPVLLAQCAQQPLHEGLAARLIVALAGDGQQAEALRRFDEIRERLEESLGLDPGPELKQAQLRVLRGRLPVGGPSAEAGGPSAGMAAPVPAQLPTDVASFTGRQAELRALDALLADPAEGGGGGPGGAPIAVISGMGGVGKTALAVRWATLARARFPDGLLYADLRGHSGSGPAEPIEVLAGFLGALGIRAQDVPANVDQASALLRSRLDGRKVLIVLDNAAGAQQVRPLLPAGAGSAAIVTARERLTGLVAREGAGALLLSTLPRSESSALVAKVIGTARARAEPAAVAALADLCAHLPLALRIAAANLATRPSYRVADYVALLSAGDRLAALAVEGDPETAVRAAFELSCDALGEPDLRMFRLAGSAPVLDLTAPSAAALAGVTQEAAVRSLEVLTERSLLIERTPGRYTFHDLLRLHAIGLAAAGPQDDAFDRLVRHYGHRVYQASELLYPHLLHVPDSPLLPPADELAAFGDGQAAMAWLQAELLNLGTLLVRLVQRGDHRVAAYLADRLGGYFILRFSAAGLRTVAQAFQEAAQAEGDPRLLAAAALQDALLEDFLMNAEASAARLTESASWAGQAGWTAGEAVALNNLARALWAAGRIEEAISRLEAALLLHRSSGRTAGEAVTLANLGTAHQELARDGGPRGAHRLGEAMRLFNEALALHRRIGDTRNEADTLRQLAEAHRELGDEGRAFDLAGEAMRLAGLAGDVRFQVSARSTMATILVRLGRTAQSLAEHRAALEQARQSGNPRLQAETLMDAAETYARLGRADDAAIAIQDAASVAAQTGSWLIGQRVSRVRQRIEAERPGLAPGTPPGTAAPASAGS
jgi:DNA-binding SARP family transcriptional activator/tetratricopeptide (TPR) repeat protein/DNA-binding XRE family transcriptional regulator